MARPRAEIWLLELIAAEELPELEACLASGMLRAEGDAVGFRHEIARATIEDELPPDRRVALHRAALAGLVGRSEPARLAHHAEAAGDGAALLEHSRVAGERAARLGAHREAAAHFAAALGHAGGLGPAARAALLEQRSQACFLSGMIQEAVDAETLALEIYATTGDRLREGDAHRWLAMFAWYQGDGPSVKAHGATAVEILETLTPGRELALAHGWRASMSMMEFDLVGAREWGERAIDLAERLGETEVVVTATRNVGTVELAHGLAEGRDKLLRSLELALDAGMDSTRRSSTATSCPPPTTSAITRRRWRSSSPAARSATSTICSPGTCTWAAGRRTSRSTTAAGPRRRRSPRETSSARAARCRIADTAR